MYTNAEDYAKVKRRVADLYKEHEKELEEVLFFSFCTLMFGYDCRSFIYHLQVGMMIKLTVKFFVNVNFDFFKQILYLTGHWNFLLLTRRTKFWWRRLRMISSWTLWLSKLKFALYVRSLTGQVMNLTFTIPSFIYLACLLIVWAIDPCFIFFTAIEQP